MSVRLAVFSDIHGNAVALDAMLDDLARRPAHATVCLGDAILTVEGDTTGVEFRRVPYPVETLARAFRESGRPYSEESLAQYGVAPAARA